MYTNETLRKVLAAMRAKEECLISRPIESIPMCISSGNRKIGRVLNVSLPPIMTCANCSECKYLCYDIKACAQYPNTVIDARMRNYVILKKDRDEYFARIQAALSSRKTNKFFRWHVAGDIVDYDYFDRMVEIARENPGFKFWTYTKNYKIVNEWIANHGGRAACPENLSIMFSEWRGIPMDNPYHFGEFRVVFKGEEKPSGHYCPGNCDICTKAGRGCIVNETTYCNEH